MARRKAAAHPVPQTLAEATELVADYVAIERRILEMQISAQIDIDRIKAERDLEIARLKGEQEGWFPALKAWWEAGGKTLAGRKRSADLAGVKLGIRRTPPAVRFARGVKLETVIAAIKAMRWSKESQVLRTKTELDKAAIIKCVAESQGEEDMLAEIGITVVQIDEFFVDAGLDAAVLRQQMEA